MRYCILLSTYNGEAYLREQLDSLLTQGADIIIRDDGSKDRTLNIIEEYKNKYLNRIFVLESDKNIGVANSFIALLTYAISLSYDYYFFCDQDDVWSSEKCERAIRMMEDKKAQLYFSRKKIVDRNLSPMDIVDKINYHGNFWDALEHSNISGCTMCIQKDLAEKVILNDFKGKRYLHDAFIYRLAVVLNLDIVNDDWESMLYRQHGDNVVGSVDNKSLTDKFSKETTKNRKHYMQEMFRDMLYQYKIPTDSRRIMEHITAYDTNIKSRFSLIGKIIGSPASPQLKAKLIIKIATNVL